MEEQSASAVPAIFDLAEAELAEMGSEIKSLGKELKGIKKRLRDMAVFADRLDQKGRIKKKSDTEFDTSPEEELMYKHRALYQETMAAKKDVLDRLTDVIPNSADIRQYNQMVLALRGIELESNEHLGSMRDLLKDLRSREEKIEDRITNILQERSRLISQMVRHKDQMEVAKQGNDTPSTGELKERLALKYGISIEQVEKMTSEKQIDVQPG